MFLTAPQYSGYFPSYFGKVHAELAGAKALTLVWLCSQRLSYPGSPRQMTFPQEGMPGSSGALGSVLSGKEITGDVSPGLWYPVSRCWVLVHANIGEELKVTSAACWKVYGLQIEKSEHAEIGH